MEEKKNIEATLQKIRTHGYWQVRFLPTRPIEKVVERKHQLSEIITKSAVHLRGWDYPHIPTGNPDNQGMYLKNDHYEGWIDWDRHKEIWRLYENGQFIHLTAIWEDWSSEDVFSPQNDPYRQIVPGQRLEIIGTLYLMTEIFSFLRNTYENGLYKDSIDVEISLNNSEGRRLWVWDPGRAPLLGDYQSHSSEIKLSRTVSKNEVIDSFENIALELTCDVFEQFQWMNPPIAVLKQDQKNLLERRF